MTYAIELLKDKLREETLKSYQFGNMLLSPIDARRHQIAADAYPDIAERIADLEKALEVLGREIPKSTV